jgi:hypothetical protein
MSAATVDLIVPLRPCTPWCRDGDGHGDEHPEDRTCWSDYAHVVLSRHKPAHYNDDTWKMAFLNVYLRREPELEEFPHVVIPTPRRPDHELRLTRDEARTLRDHLTGLIATAEAD